MFFCIILFLHITIYYILKKSIETNIKSELDNSSILIRNMVETSANLSIKNHLRALSQMSKNTVDHIYNLYKQGRLTEDQAKQQASRILLSHQVGKTGYIYCLSSEGGVQVHPVSTLVGADISDYEFVKTQIARKEGYLEYSWMNPNETDPRDKALYMTYFQPWDWIISVSSYRDEFIDLVNVNDFKTRIKTITFGLTGYPYVIDSQGMAIIHPSFEGQSIWNYKDDNGRYFIQEICKKKNGSIVYPWKNPGDKAARDKLVYYSYIPDYDWIVASSSYMEEFYRPLDYLLYTIVGSFFIALLFILPLTMWIGNLIIKPLQTAIYKLKHVKDYDYSVRMPIRTEDEIGQLSECFNDYMENLEQHRDSLNELNEGLERRVEERTAKLQEALTRVKTLSGLLPICVKCKKIRNDKGYWEQIETYIEEYSDAHFSHGMCEDCANKLYGEQEWYKKSKQKNPTTQ
jgi:two-component system NtrC family sensor kinase